MKMSIILSTLVLLANIWTIHGDIYNDTVDKLKKKGFKKAAVLDDDAHFIAASGGFNINLVESNQLVKLFDDPSSAYSSGFTLDGVKYETVTKADERSLYGKMKKGKEGAIIVRSSSHFIIGIYNATLNSGVAANAVEERGDVFRDNGY